MSKLSKSRRVATIKRNAKRNCFNAVCESLEGRQLLSNSSASITGIDAIADVVQGQAVSVTFHYDATGKFAKASLTIDPQGVNLNTGFVDEAVGTNLTATLSETVPSNLSAGQHEVEIHLVSNDSDTSDAYFKVKLNVIQTTVLNVSGTGTYGATGQVTATLKDASDPSLISGKTIYFYKGAVADANLLGSATTVNGVATLQSDKSFGLDAGDTGITAVFEGDDAYAASSNTGTLHVNQADLTVNIGNLTKTYGQSANLTTLGATVATGVNNENLVITYSSDGADAHANVQAGGYAINGVLSNGTGKLSNYNVIINPGTLTVNKADVQSLSVPGYNVTYDGLAHTATGTATGVFGEDLSSLLDLSGTTHTNAGTYTDTWSFAGNNNYNAVSNQSVTDFIAQKALTVDFITQDALNLAKQGPVTFTAAAPTGLASTDTVDVLKGATVIVKINGDTFTATNFTVDQYGQLSFSLALTATAANDSDTLYSDLKSDTTATSAAKAPIVYFNISGSTTNYTFADSAATKLFSTTK
jgi:hypothetical protein